MQILLGALIALLGIGIVLISRSITTFFHELGHALPALLFTEKEVTIYVGSYGDVSDSLRLQSGRLTIYLRFNFLAWNLGLCTHEGARVFWQAMVIILGGPLASLLLALSLINYWSNSQVSESVIMILAIFTTSAIWDFIINLIPRKAAMQVHDGSVAYSDGYQLMRLFREMRYPEQYFKGQEHFYKKEYDQALASFEAVIQEGVKSSDLYKQAILAAMLNYDYESALKFYDQYQSWYKPRPEDFALLGDIHYGLHQYEKALKAYNQAWYFRAADKQVLLKRGKLFLHFGENEMALRDFDTAIMYDPKLAEAYAQRGLAQIQMENLESAKQDVEVALELGAEKGLAYFVLGKYYEQTKQYARALEYYEMAKAEKFNHHGLDFLIENMKGW